MRASLVAALVLCGARNAASIAVMKRAPKIRADPAEVFPDPSSYAYMRAAKAKAAVGLEDDFALFAERPPPLPLSVDDAAVVEAASVRTHHREALVRPLVRRTPSPPTPCPLHPPPAQWALHRLRNMSDSGIFRTLALQRVVNASFQPGAYHNNTIMFLELASPALLDGDASSTHAVVVLTDLEDGVRSLAIDEFPLMEPEAVEEAWRQKVVLSREARALEFRVLDWEGAAWTAKTGGVMECVDLCDERQTSINDFNFPADEQLRGLEAEREVLRARSLQPPDLSRFLARQAARHARGGEAAEGGAPGHVPQPPVPRTEL